MTKIAQARTEAATTVYPTLTADATVQIHCGRCDGKGSVSWGAPVDGALTDIRTGRVRIVPQVCFECNGTGGHKTVTVASLREAEAKRIVAHNRKAEKEAARLEPLRAARVAWNSEHADLIARVEGIEIAQNILGPIFRVPTDDQVALMVRLADERDAEAARVHTPVPEGLMEITGEVVSVKSVDGYAYGSLVLKMVVADDRGFRVWGTVPAKIDVAKGVRVAFTATVTRSDRDDEFGFFKRPKQARIV